MKPRDILKQYWNYDSFRPLQEPIVQSVLDGLDTMALLPTGGGKSICFQVPAMVKPGICLVISPLVALMKDQVANLAARNIRAIAMTGALSVEQTSDLLDNCQYGGYKFLYLSPERLQNDWVLERLQQLDINLIAIDEAHCVSQWGHDFRPAYLKIGTLRQTLRHVPVLALTATANQRVQDDIAEHLELKNPAIFKQSFARENLAYWVVKTEDKLNQAAAILKKYPEPSILYVRNRKAVMDTARQLNVLGISATGYHGGMTQREKDANMKAWMDEKVMAMVATNAFGMGIDKANVRTVIHLGLPENLENYYQEAGRAGRNGEKAYAVLLTQAADVLTAESQFIKVLPDKAFLNDCFRKLCNHLQIAYGEGINQRYPLNFNQFCQKYGLPPLTAHHALEFLDRQGVITLSREFSQKLTLQFTIDSREMLRYISLNPKDEPVLLAILRNYPGIYENPQALNLAFIAKKSGAPEDGIQEILERAAKQEVAQLTARPGDTIVQFNEIREDERTIARVAKYLTAQNDLKKHQLAQVIAYATNESRCKSRMLLEYFGEPSGDCGNCSYCSRPAAANPKNIGEAIVKRLAEGPATSQTLQNELACSQNDLIFALRELMADERISLKPDNTYTLRP